MKYLSLFFLTLPAWAQFSGDYTGTGTAVFKSGRQYECSEIYLRLEQTQNLFRLRDGGYHCGDLLQASFDPFKLTIRDGKLWNVEEELGSVNEQILTYKIFDPEDGSTYQLKLTKLPSGGIHYYEDWHDGEAIALKVHGDLKAISK